MIVRDINVYLRDGDDDLLCGATLTEGGLTHTCQRPDPHPSGDHRDSTTTRQWHNDDYEYGLTRASTEYR